MEAYKTYNFVCSSTSIYLFNKKFSHLFIPDVVWCCAGNTNSLMPGDMQLLDPCKLFLGLIDRHEIAEQHADMSCQLWLLPIINTLKCCLTY